jgi:hypothetical protein
VLSNPAHHQGNPVTTLVPYLDAAFHVAIADLSMSLESMQHVHAMIPHHVEHMAHVPPPGGWENFQAFPMTMCDQFYAHMHHDVPPAFGPTATIFAQFEFARPYVLFVQGRDAQGDLIFARFLVDVHQVRARRLVLLLSPLCSGDSCCMPWCLHAKLQ